MGEQARVEATQLAPCRPGDRHARVAPASADVDAEPQALVEGRRVRVREMRLQAGLDLVRYLPGRVTHCPGEFPGQLGLPGAAQVTGDRLQLGRRLDQAGHGASLECRYLRI